MEKSFSSSVEIKNSDGLISPTELVTSLKEKWKTTFWYRYKFEKLYTCIEVIHSPTLYNPYDKEHSDGYLFTIEIHDPECLAHSVSGFCGSLTEFLDFDDIDVENIESSINSLVSEVYKRTHPW